MRVASRVMLLRHWWVAAASMVAALAAVLVVPSVVLAASAPTVAAVSPATGAQTGGTVITITGTGFVAGASVTVQGVAATGVVVVGATQITATTPAGTPGPATIAVTNADTQSGTLNGAFAYLGVAPTVAVATPNSGTSIGGTSVVLTGTGFVAGALVTFGGTLATSVVVDSPTQITATTPAHTAGVGNVVVTNTDTQSGTLAAGYTFTAAAPPTVLVVAPTSGTTGGGTPVTITGTGFVAGATVKFGADAATSVVVVSAAQLTAVTPAHAAGTVAVTVTNSDTQSGTLGAAFTYAASAAPMIATVSPTTGPLAGGTTITITGTGFLAGATVAVGATAATNVVVVSATSITAKTPAKTAVGAVSVKVTNTDAQSVTLASPAFTYVGPPKLTDVTPASGSVGGGTVVKITGSGFATGATVTFGGTAATSVVFVSATELTATTPAHAAGKVEVIVKNLDAQLASKADAYTYAPGPTITSVTPLSGGSSGGTLVTITGTNFDTGTSVKFGANAGTAVAVATGGKSLTVKTPAGTSTATVTVTIADGQAINFALPFVYTIEAGSIIGGSVPTVGIGLIVFSGGTNDQLVAAAIAGGCTGLERLVFNSLVSGKWFVYIPGAPAVVNAAWGTQYSGGLPPTIALFMRCLEA